MYVNAYEMRTLDALHRHDRRGNGLRQHLWIFNKIYKAVTNVMTSTVAKTTAFTYENRKDILFYTELGMALAELSVVAAPGYY